MWPLCMAGNIAEEGHPWIHGWSSRDQFMRCDKGAATKPIMANGATTPWRMPVSQFLISFSGHRSRPHPHAPPRCLRATIPIGETTTLCCEPGCLRAPFLPACYVIQFRPVFFSPTRVQLLAEKIGNSPSWVMRYR